MKVTVAQQKAIDYNALQARFLDGKFTHRFIKEVYLYPKEDSLGWDMAFEEQGASVRITADDGTPLLKDRCIMVLIEPTLGNNYPTLLRKLKRMHHSMYKHHEQIFALLFKDFTADGVTLEQVQEMFSDSGVRLASVADVEARTIDPSAE